MEIDVNFKRSPIRSLRAFALRGLVVVDNNLQKADSTDIIAHGRCVAEVDPITEVKALYGRDMKELNAGIDC